MIFLITSLKYVPQFHRRPIFKPHQKSIFSGKENHKETRGTMHYSHSWGTPEKDKTRFQRAINLKNQKSFSRHDKSQMPDMVKPWNNLLSKFEEWLKNGEGGFPRCLSHVKSKLQTLMTLRLRRRTIGGHCRKECGWRTTWCKNVYINRPFNPPISLK